MINELISLREDIISCTDCESANLTCKHFPFELSFDYIPRKTKILFLAQDPPGKSDNYFYKDHKNTFSQKIFKLLTASRLLTNLTMEDFIRQGFYLTDAVKCFNGEINKCRKFLLREIQIIKPEIICTLGLNALKAITISKKISLSNYVGKVIPNSMLIDELKDIVYVFSCYFPLTTPVGDLVRLEHFKRLKELIL